MIDVFIGIIFNFLALAIIGIGLALFLLSDESRVEVSFAIAPALGFALSSIFGTYLVLLDLPVSKWDVPWLIISGAISLALCFVSTRIMRRGFGSVNWRTVIVFGSGVLLTLVLATTPMIVGGLDFTVLRGNGTDSFNYMTLAGYLDHEPLSWVYQVDTQTLVRRHPSYGLARGLLGSRWTTSAMLAWMSSIGQVPLYRFEYGFSLLSFMLAFGPAFCLALKTGIRPVYAFLLSMAVCVGFWAQFVLDIRAISQTNSLPVMLLLALLFARIEDTQDWHCLGERLLLAIAFVALIFLYPEVVPMTLFALAIYVAVCCFRKAYSVRKAVAHFVTFGIAVLGVIPLAPFLWRFLMHQMTYAARGQNTWHQVYFSWLYSNPSTGLWGLSHFSLDRPILLQSITVLVGLVLSFLLIFGVIKGFFSGKNGFPAAFLVTICFGFAAIIQFLYLFVQKQLWAAGKGLSFGYPFILIATVACGLTVWNNQTFRGSVPLIKITKGVIVLWLVIQCGLGAYRIGYAYTGRDYSKFIGQHGEYRHHDWKVADFFNVLDKNKNITVWASVGNSWVSEYLGFVFGWDTNFVNLDGVIREGKDFLSTAQKHFQFPQYLILNKNNFLNFGGIPPFIVAQNSELLLVRVSPELLQKPVLLGIQNPNGIEIDGQGKKFFWMGGKPTSLRLLAVSEGEILLRARYVMGPSLPDKSGRDVIISSSADKEEQHILVTEATRDIRIPVRKGFNEISFKIDDIPTLSKLPSGDTRPLLLGVYRAKISFEARSTMSD